MKFLKFTLTDTKALFYIRQDLITHFYEDNMIMNNKNTACIKIFYTTGEKEHWFRCSKTIEEVNLIINS